jgi:hypothetical protein
MIKCTKLVSTRHADGIELIDVCGEWLFDAPDFHANVLRGQCVKFEFLRIDVFGKTNNPAISEMLLLPFTGNDVF